MRKNVIRLTLCAMLFALSYSASAQQPKKVPRIGYLAAGDRPVNPAHSEAFRQVCGSLGMWRGKTS